MQTKARLHASVAIMDTKKTKEVWDVAVIGGGAAGMMAAGAAAEAGARVVLIEKNTALGRKLLITGGGRCNITNAEFDIRTLLAKFNSRGQSADRYLFSPFSRHGVSESLAFFNDRGLGTKVENRKRVFPITDSAESVFDVLQAYLVEGKVQIISGTPVRRLVKAGKEIDHVLLANDQRIYAKSYILATGGLSRPETGSTGDGFTWLKELGHTVIKPDPSLVPLTLKDSWVSTLAGVSLPDVILSIREDGKKVCRQAGGMLFTHQGVSGPAALHISKDVGDRLPYGPVELSLDLLPKESLESLDLKLQEVISESSNKKIRNVLGGLLPGAIVPVVLLQAELDEDTPGHSVTREKRILLGTVIKNLALQVKGRLGFEKAVIASGGVSLEEIDTKTMQSKVISNLYIIGDLLNIDRPSGGYSLQLCWTTGVVAGQGAYTKN